MDLEGQLNIADLTCQADDRIKSQEPKNVNYVF